MHMRWLPRTAVRGQQWNTDMIRGTDVVGYSYNADVWCEECAEKKFPVIEQYGHLADLSETLDDDGDVVYAIFRDTECDHSPVCGGCGEYIAYGYFQCWSCEEPPRECVCEDCSEPKCANLGAS